MSVQVGISMVALDLEGDVRRRAETVGEFVGRGIDHVQVGDHVSFRGGAGEDALVNAASFLSMHESVRVFVAVYLLPLRHPVVVARQLSSLSQIAPGRLTFGVGVGGEDRNETWACGVDPATRGQRMDECLHILQALATGEAVTFRGRFFELDEVRVLPVPEPPIPIVVGGRSEAAVRRAGRVAAGWVGIWVSARRFAAVVSEIEADGEQQGTMPGREHALSVWCGLGTSRSATRAKLAGAMESFYGIPFTTFERYCPYGAPEDVAEFLAPYVEAGCRSFNLLPCGSSDEMLDHVGELTRLLKSV